MIETGSFAWLSPNSDNRTGRDIARYYAKVIKGHLESDQKDPQILAAIFQEMRNLKYVVGRLGIPVEPVDFDDPSMRIGTKFFEEANRYVSAVETFIPLENEPDVSIGNEGE